MNKDPEQRGWVWGVDHDERAVVSRLFFMNPLQVSLLEAHGHVLIVDTTENRNMFRYHLTTICVVDGENKRRNIAHLLHETHDQET